MATGEVKLQSYQENCTDLEKQVSVKNQELSQKQEIIESLKQIHKQNEEKIADLNQNLQQSGATIETLSDRVKSLNQKVGEIREQSGVKYRNYVKTIESVTKQKNEMTETIEKKNGEIGSRNQKISELEETIVKKDEEIRTLNQKVGELESNKKKEISESNKPVENDSLRAQIPTKMRF